MRFIKGCLEPRLSLIYVCLLLMAGVSQSSAQESGVQNKSDPRLEESAGLGGGSLEISGLVINQTVSRLGQEFYSDFLKVWLQQPRSNLTNIVIREQRSGTSTNTIHVLYEGVTLYQTNLSIRTQLESGVFQMASQRVMEKVIASRRSRSQDLYYTEF